jgi:hypothetical protein
MLLLISTHGTSCQRIIMQFRHIALQMNHLSCVSGLRVRVTQRSKRRWGARVFEATKERTCCGKDLFRLFTRFLLFVVERGSERI